MADIVERLRHWACQEAPGSYRAPDLEKAADEIERFRRLEEAAKSGGSVPYGWYAAAVEDCDEALRRVTVTDEMVERALGGLDGRCIYGRPPWSPDDKALMRAALTAALRGPT